MRVRALTPRTRFSRLCVQELKFPLQLSEGLTDLMTKLLSKDPKTRISIQGIMVREREELPQALFYLALALYLPPPSSL